MLQRASVVQPFDESESSIIMGLGAEFGFQNGFAFRGEVSRFDSDATMFGLGVVYRLGMTASQFGTVVASAAKEHIPGSTSILGEPTLGAAMPETAAAPGHVSLIHKGPHAALWSNPGLDGDADGDTVLDKDDLCPGTERNTAVSQNGCGLFDSVLSNVNFKPGTHWLTPKARRSIDEIVDVLLAFPEARIEVQAHADSKGPEEINQIVSTARAEAVAKYMMKQGVGEKQLIAKGYGESMPIASNDTKEGRLKNRRVQLVTLPSLTPAEIESQGLEGTAAVEKVAAKPKKAQPKIDVTMETGDIKALAKAAEEFDRPGSSATQVAAASAGVEPSLAAALPDTVGANALPGAVRVSSLGLGGPLKNVRFKPGTNELEASSIAELTAVSDQLKRHNGVRVAVLVHVNEPLDTVANLALSREQANSLVEYLASQGIQRDRLIAEGYGDALPLAQTVSERDRNRNRRVELRVINPPTQ